MARRASTHPQILSPPRTTILLAFEWQYDPLDRGIVEYARGRGWRLLDLRTYDMGLPRSFRPDGAIFCLPTERMPLVKKLLGLGVPVVQIDDQIPRRNWPCVLRGGTAIGSVAAEHFLARGFKNLAYLRSCDRKWGSQHAKLECEGFLARARQAGVEAKVFTIQRAGHAIPWSRCEPLIDRFRKAISNMDLPLGIFTYHDLMALRICHFCESIGLSVPEQVSVLGCGNNVLRCDCASTPLSSVDPDTFDQGRTAAALLDRMMAGEPAPREPIMIPPKALVTRQSTDVLAVPDLDVARALRYIWAHMHECITVQNVADAVGTGRRTLERSFQAHLHRTVNDEITRKRIERCCELLAGTKKPVSAIAGELGGLSESYLFRLFRKATGMTPRQYRSARGLRRDGSES